MEAAQDSAELRGLAQRLEEAVRRARRAAEGLADLGAPVALAEDELDRRIHAVLARLDADTYSIPPRFRREVVGLIDAYMRSSVLAELRQRERRPRPMITRELEAFGLPEELRYLAWVESDMVPSQVGRAGASGLWQFSPELARAYGLRIECGGSHQKSATTLPSSLQSRFSVARLRDLRCADAGAGVALRQTTLGGPSGALSNRPRAAG